MSAPSPPSSPPPPCSMPDLLALHRKQAKALQARITALRKEALANKKRKKDIVAQIHALQTQLDTAHAQDIQALQARLSATSLLSTAHQPPPPPSSLSSSPPLPSSPPSSASPKPPSRQQRRKARKLAALVRDASLTRLQALDMPPDPAVAEAQQLDAVLRRHGLRVHDIAADGHCLFNSISHQLSYTDTMDDNDDDDDDDDEGDATSAIARHDHQSLRALAAQSILAHRHVFLPYLLDEQSGQLMTLDQLDRYVDQLVHTPMWGGHIEIKALSMALNRSIHVFHALSSHPLIIDPHLHDDNDNDNNKDDTTKDHPVDVTSCSSGPDSSGSSLAPPLRICYVQHQFGLGEHYHSLVSLS